MTNIYQTQANELIMCGYFFIGFIDFVLNNKRLVDFPDLFSPQSFRKNDELILEHFR